MHCLRQWTRHCHHCHHRRQTHQPVQPQPCASSCLSSLSLSLSFSLCVPKPKGTILLVDNHYRHHHHHGHHSPQPRRWLVGSVALFLFLFDSTSRPPLPHLLFSVIICWWYNSIDHLEHSHSLQFSSWLSLCCVLSVCLPQRLLFVFALFNLTWNGFCWKHLQAGQ